jgi:hypothetical protein
MRSALPGCAACAAARRRTWATNGSASEATTLRSASAAGGMRSVRPLAARNTAPSALPPSRSGRQVTDDSPSCTTERTAA